jgi:hypothetical protein
MSTLMRRSPSSFDPSPRRAKVPGLPPASCEAKQDAWRVLPLRRQRCAVIARESTNPVDWIATSDTLVRDRGSAGGSVYCPRVEQTFERGLDQGGGK